MPHVGAQFIRVFRGLHSGIHDGKVYDQGFERLNTEDIGNHWTTNHAMASSFASGNIGHLGHGGTVLHTGNVSRKPGTHGMVLEGLVHKDDVHPWSENDPELKKLQVYPPDLEHEITVKPGKSVKLTRATKVKITKSDSKKGINKTDAVESQEFSSPIDAKTGPKYTDQTVLREGQSYVPGRKYEFVTSLNTYRPPK
jgi:hypothetical protein